MTKTFHTSSPRTLVRQGRISRSMQKGFRVLLLCVGFLFLSCAKGGPFVTLHVLDLPIGTNALSLKVTANGTSKEQRFSGSDPLTLFTVELPAGTRGETRFDLEALTTDCVLGNGSAVLQIEEDTSYDVEAAVVLKSYRSCGINAYVLTLQKAGTGLGTVTTSSPDLVCDQSCKTQIREFPPGTQVKLTAKPDKKGLVDDLFIGWTDGCSGIAKECTFTITKDTIVTATFDKCQGFCPMPTTGTTNDLFAVWGQSQNDMYAVGANGTILKWDGQAWSSMSSGVSTNLRAITAPKDKPALLLAGGDGSSLLTFDGTKWNSNTNSLLKSAINGIGANTSGNIYMVGNGDMYVRWDGNKKWERPAGYVNINSNSLTGISFVPGSEEHFFSGTSDFCERYASLLYWKQTTNTNNDLLGVWANSSAIYVVGKNGTIARRPSGDGQNFTSMTSGTTTTLRSVFGANDSMIFAVGDGGTALMWNGTNWSKIATNTAQPLYGVYAVNSSTIIAVGGSGTALIYNP